MTTDLLLHPHDVIRVGRTIIVPEWSDLGPRLPAPEHLNILAPPSGLSTIWDPPAQVDLLSPALQVEQHPSSLMGIDSPYSNHVKLRPLPGCALVAFAVRISVDDHEGEEGHEDEDLVVFPTNLELPEGVRVGLSMGKDGLSLHIDSNVSPEVHPPLGVRTEPDVEAFRMLRTLLGS